MILRMRATHTRRPSRWHRARSFCSALLFLFFVIFVCFPHLSFHFSLARLFCEPPCRAARRNQHLFHLNYAVTLYRHGERRKAQEHFQRFEQLFDELSNEERMESPEVLDLRRSLAPAFRSSS